jgi:hypothetical protein
MNNKLIFSSILFFVPFLVASENPQNIFDKKVEALIQVEDLNSSRKAEKDRYEIIGTYGRLGYCDTMHFITEKDQTITSRKFSVDKIREYKGYSTEIEGFSAHNGVATNEFTMIIRIDGENNTLFYQKIRDYYDRYKKYNTCKDSFYVHFLKKQDHLEKQTNFDVISLDLTEEKVQEIIEKSLLQKSSAIRPILAVLGAAGLIAFLIHHFNLYPKFMALWQRS